MTTMLEGVASVITALGVIIIAYLNFYQRSYDKKTDYRLEKMQRDEAEKRREYKQNIGRIYGVLHHLLYSTSADRISIIQPHPLKDGHWLSISLSLAKSGVADGKDLFQNVEMDKVPRFVGDISQRQFIYWRDVRHDCKDVTYRSIASLNGTIETCILRLEDGNSIWIGNLMAEWVADTDINIEDVKAEMKDAGESIQYILPEYEPKLPPTQIG